MASQLLKYVTKEGIILPDGFKWDDFKRTPAIVLTKIDSSSIGTASGNRIISPKHCLNRTAEGEPKENGPSDLPTTDTTRKEQDNKANTKKRLNRDTGKYSTVTEGSSYSNMKMRSDRKLSCNLCNFVSYRKGHLREHMRTHTGEKPFKCSLCNYASSYKGALSVHMRTHTGEKPFKCSLCDRTFSQNGALIPHMRTHTGEKPFKCSLCDSAFTQNGALIHHMRTHTGEKPFKCALCNYASPSKSKLSEHMKTHTTEKPYKCPLCNYATYRKADLPRHVRNHTGEKPFKCGFCSYAASCKGVLSRHMKRHTGEKPFKCSMCNYASYRKSHLSQHMRTHTGEKPFKCSLCNYVSSAKGDLSRHMMRHTVEKPFKCGLCSYAASYQGGLSRHMKRHNGEKPFKCSMCNYASYRKSHLSQHMRTHTGEKPFRCSLCNYVSSYKRALSEHLRTHTGEKGGGGKGDPPPAGDGDLSAEAGISAPPVPKDGASATGEGDGASGSPTEEPERAKRAAAEAAFIEDMSRRRRVLRSPPGTLPPRRSDSCPRLVQRTMVDFCAAALPKAVSSPAHDSGHSPSPMRLLGPAGSDRRGSSKALLSSLVLGLQGLKELLQDSAFPPDALRTAEELIRTASALEFGGLPRSDSASAATQTVSPKELRDSELVEAIWHDIAAGGALADVVLREWPAAAFRHTEPERKSIINCSGDRVVICSPGEEHAQDTLARLSKQYPALAKVLEGPLQPGTIVNLQRTDRFHILGDPDSNADESSKRLILAICGPSDDRCGVIEECGKLLERIGAVLSCDFTVASPGSLPPVVLRKMVEVVLPGRRSRVCCVSK